MRQVGFPYSSNKASMSQELSTIDSTTINYKRRTAVLLLLNWYVQYTV